MDKVKPGLSIAQCVTAACLLEATAPKPGNVHRAADFENLSFVDFVAAAVGLGPAIAMAPDVGVGAASLAAVQAMKDLTGRNTSLGTILLLTPLAAVPADRRCRQGVAGVLANLSSTDSQLTYQAIRLAQPGGLGTVDSMDIHSDPPESLLDAMRMAAPYDSVARQYVSNFHEIVEDALPTLVGFRDFGLSLTQSIIQLQLTLLARVPDSLIRRKCGLEIAQRVSNLAHQVLQSGPPDSDSYQNALADFDFWLRADGNRRNPGTTADMIAATLFAGLRDGVLHPPFR